MLFYDCQDVLLVPSNFRRSPVPRTRDLTRISPRHVARSQSSSSPSRRRQPIAFPLIHRPRAILPGPAYPSALMTIVPDIGVAKL